MEDYKQANHKQSFSMLSTKQNYWYLLIYHCWFCCLCCAKLGLFWRAAILDCKFWAVPILPNAPCEPCCCCDCCCCCCCCGCMAIRPPGLDPILNTAYKKAQNEHFLSLNSHQTQTSTYMYIYMYKYICICIHERMSRPLFILWSLKIWDAWVRWGLLPGNPNCRKNWTEWVRLHLEVMTKGKKENWM